MRLDPELTRALDATGKPWRMANGSRHVKLFMDDRLIGILPHNGRLENRSPNARKNLLAQIRRAGQDRGAGA
jgi:hypothetical protein